MRISITIWFLLCMHLLPFVMTQMAIGDFPYASNKKRKKMIIHASVFSALGNLFILWGSLKRAYQSQIWKKLGELVLANCSYEDVSKLATTDIVCLAGALLIIVFAHAIASTGVPYKEKIKKKKRYLLMITLAAIPIIESFSISEDGARCLSFSGVCRKMTVIHPATYSWQLDKEDNDASFVSVRNNGQLAVALNDYFLSSDEDFLQYYRIDNYELQPGEEFKVVMDGDKGLDIKKDGGSVVYLTNRIGDVIDQLTVPALQREECYQYEAGAWNIVLNIDEANMQEEISKPIFSQASGFYSSEFYLQISTEEDTDIFYTLDGSKPSENSEKYEKPIRIYDKSNEPNVLRSVKNVTADYLENWEEPECVDKAFVIRAIAVGKNGECSDITTATYFINLDQYRDKTVISLVADPNELFGEDGIYVTGKEYDEWYTSHLADILAEKEKEEIGVTTDDSVRLAAPLPNYRKRGDDWERSADMEMFREGEIYIDQPIGIKIQGASSSTRPLKRFSLISRKDYSDSSWFLEPLFADHLTHSATLREGFLNAFSQMLMEGRSVAVQDSIPVVVFLNGEYWYDTYLQEKYSKFLFEQRYGVSRDNVQTLRIGYERNMSEEEVKLYKTSISDYLDTYDLADSDDYEKLCQIMDVQSYIDYSCANLYMGNMDTGDKMNTCLWRTYLKENESYGDGRWRWAFYDMDLDLLAARRALGYQTDAEVNSFSDIQPYSRIIFDQEPLFSSLKKNPDFCRQFVITFMDLVNENFAPKRVAELITQYSDDTIESYNHGFFLHRADNMVPYLADEFSLKGTKEQVMIASSAEGKKISLNTINAITQKDGETWSGQYFTDYPITLSTDEPDFQCWVIVKADSTEQVTDKTVEINVPEGGVQVYAKFKQD